MLDIEGTVRWGYGSGPQISQSDDSSCWFFADEDRASYPEAAEQAVTAGMVGRTLEGYAPDEAVVLYDHDRCLRKPACDIGRSPWSPREAVLV